jgi:hypothetical protein
VSINPITNPTPSIVTHTRDNILLPCSWPKYVGWGIGCVVKIEMKCGYSHPWGWRRRDRTWPGSIEITHLLPPPLCRVWVTSFLKNSLTTQPHKFWSWSQRQHILAKKVTSTYKTIRCNDTEDRNMNYHSCKKSKAVSANAFTLSPFRILSNYPSEILRYGHKNLSCVLI